MLYIKCKAKGSAWNKTTLLKTKPLEVHTMNELSLFNSLFDDSFGLSLPGLCAPAGRFNFPNVDVRSTKDSYILEMDLPGKTENDVDLSLKDGVLTISSVEEAKSAKEEKAEEKASLKNEETYLVRERRSYKFTRSFNLPKDIDADTINATFKNGVLTIMVNRKTAPEARRIAINAA